MPAIIVATTANYDQAFTSPRPQLKAILSNAEGRRIGRASYAVSPLDDRVYVSRIDIDPTFRRQGYGLAFLWYLADRHRLPITPIQESSIAREYWNAARLFSDSGLVVTTSISEGDMSHESRRWKHFRPEIERLQQQIAERKSKEAYLVAVGRGLDAPLACPDTIAGGGAAIDGATSQ